MWLSWEVAYSLQFGVGLTNTFWEESQSVLLSDIRRVGSQPIRVNMKHQHRIGSTSLHLGRRACFLSNAFLAGALAGCSGQAAPSNAAVAASRPDAPTSTAGETASRSQSSASGSTG